MMNETNLEALTINLHETAIGSLMRLQGDKNLLSFNQKYVEDSQRATLSQSFTDQLGDLIVDHKITRTRLPPFFSNLLPEGPMREYLATQAKVNPQREFYLLAALGEDLPGALKVVHHLQSLALSKIEELDVASHEKKSTTALHFSLAGVQLKFSAIWEHDKGLTIPADGVGGSWIVKLPSPIYAGVTQNEYVMMELARQIGIDVPETALIPIDLIYGLPKGFERSTSEAFIIKRFDRDDSGKGIHIEDFAQVFGVYPEQKYRAASYRNIAQVIWSEIGEKGEP
jgi:serine/threonine-protein kinase HipA